MTQPLLVLEFFSGLGGMHFALEDSGLPHRVLAAFDIDAKANATYQHNFPDSPKPRTGSVESLKLDALAAFGANTWLMSPPCQPFTRGGNLKDHDDARSRGLLFLIDALGKLAHPPTFVLVENVLNFESSTCCERLRVALHARGYVVHECLVSPKDAPLHIPNNRLRYYLTARLCLHGPASSSEASVPAPPRVVHAHLPLVTSEARRMALRLPVAPSLPLRAYLDNLPLAAAVPYAVPEAYLRSCPGFKFDIVTGMAGDAEVTSTFTKAYGSHYVIGTGAYLQTNPDTVINDMADPTQLLAARLRYFTPSEIARLQGFPQPEPTSGDESDAPTASATFRARFLTFPPGFSLRDCYKLLGNSLNVKVVSYLLHAMHELGDDTTVTSVDAAAASAAAASAP